jgi:hypothetical protein
MRLSVRLCLGGYAVPVEVDFSASAGAMMDGAVHCRLFCKNRGAIGYQDKVCFFPQYSESRLLRTGRESPWRMYGHSWFDDAP